MRSSTHIIELPVAPEEAVAVLRRELRAAEHRLAEARRAAAFSAFRDSARRTGTQWSRGSSI